MSRNDVAIYAPEAAGLYEREPRETGGAEVQTALLARSLADRGVATAHVVFPLADPADPAGSPAGAASVLQRAAYDPRPRVEALRLWRALEAADARTYVYRMSSPSLGVLAGFCRARRRSLVFASANDSDFTFERMGARPGLALYRFGVRCADAVVVQTSRQEALARRAFSGLARLEQIPSFAEPADPQSGEPLSFLWTARLVDYKQPLRYLDLAEALPQARFRMIAVETGETPPKLGAEVRSRAAGLPNLELLGPRGRGEVGALVDEAVAVVSTSRLEGMPNVFLEGWARGVPALSLDFDPDGRIAAHRLGAAADGSFERFAAAAWELWQRRGDRADVSERVRSYVQDAHSLEAVGERWASVIEGAGRS